MEQNESWVIFSNKSETVKYLVIEPYAVKWEMPKDDYFYVYMKQSYNHLTCVEIYDDSTVIWADKATIYHRNHKIWDFSGENIPPPDFD